jgi:hypothetical protein
MKLHELFVKYTPHRLRILMAGIVIGPYWAFKPDEAAEFFSDQSAGRHSRLKGEKMASLFSDRSSWQEQEKEIVKAVAAIYEARKEGFPVGVVANQQVLERNVEEALRNAGYDV